MMMGRGGGGPPSLIAVVLVMVASCLPAVAQETSARPRDGGIYRRPLANDPAVLDPALISDIYSRSVAHQIFDGLVQFDQTLTITPALAEFWKSSRDGLVWTFKLRRGVQFHHGREVTAADVVYTLTRILDPKTRSGAADLFSNIRGAQAFRAGSAESVSGLVVLDRYTVQVTLEEAQIPFVSVLAVGHAKIVPRDVVERMGDAFGTRPVGSGPFKLVEWERGKEIVLSANPNYFDGAPHLSQIVYRIFPGDPVEAMFEEFRRGNLEDAPIPMEQYQRAIGTRSYVHVKRPMINVRFYGFNTRIRPLDDRRVRQAFVLAVDREALTEELTLGRFVFARGILPPGSYGFNPMLRGYPYNPDRARALLAEAGYPGGRGLTPISIWSTAKLEKEHDRLRKQLEAVGIPVEFKYVTDWPAFSTMLAEGRAPVFLYAWFADVPDPDNFLFKLFHSRGSRNFFGYANQSVDALLAAARNTSDARQRVDLYRRAEQQIVDDAPIMPFFHYTYERVFQPYVRSVEVNGLGDPYIPLRKIWLDRR